VTPTRHFGRRCAKHDDANARALEPRDGAAKCGSAHAFKAFVLMNAFGYGLLSSRPVALPVFVRVANGVYELGLKTYTSSVPSSP
jgi:hypothetical protein